MTQLTEINKYIKIWQKRRTHSTIIPVTIVTMMGPYAWYLLLTAFIFHILSIAYIRTIRHWPDERLFSPGQNLMSSCHKEEMLRFYTSPICHTFYVPVYLHNDHNEHMLRYLRYRLALVYQWAQKKKKCTNSRQ